MKAIAALLVLALSQAAGTASQDRIMQAVRAAIAPALPYPEADQSGAVPTNNDTTALWMVRRLEPGDTAIEVLANPLNQQNQLAAAKAMAQIQSNIESAQRRAEDQYQRALEAVKRTGKSQDVDGITLADEGVAGEKIDAESHVTIEVLFNQPEYRFAIRGRVEPGPGLPFPLTHVNVFAHTYKQDADSGPEHYKEAERIVFLGAVARPLAAQRGREPIFDVVVKATPAAGSLAVHLRGNQALIDEITAKTNWNQLLELLK